jgi:exodeoxyribonuclease V beta subunit
VQVVTVHASKGLEFPVVYVPFAWDRYESKAPALLRYHDDDGTRVLHVGGPEDDGYAAARDRHLAEERGEDLRLLYVALTRARCQVVTWWTPSNNSAGGALTRLLLGERAVGEQPPSRVVPPADDALATRFAALTEAGSVAVETVDSPPEEAHWQPPEMARPPLSVDHLSRHLDLVWRRTSYSGLTAAAHERPAGVSTEPDAGAVTDEADIASVADGAPSDPTEGHLVPPMADMPGGTAFGTLVHAVLEHTDPGAVDLPGELGERCRLATPRVPGVDPDELAAALVPVLSTPLGPAPDDLALRDVPLADRLAELEFELPLAGGDTPVGAGSTLDDIAALLRRHLPAGDVFAPYADQLAAAGLGAGRLRGYLTGSLDAVLRLPGPGGKPRYVVVDYKTNRLARVDEQLTTWHYRPQAMAEAMMAAHYPLQLLLYCVALHRFLRWRQPGYDPARHLGGGLYLFVRGMCGPDTPVVDGARCGVMAWRPPDALVVELSALLAGLPAVTR